MLNLSLFEALNACTASSTLSVVTIHTHHAADGGGSQKRRSPWAEHVVSKEEGVMKQAVQVMTRCESLNCSRLGTCCEWRSLHFAAENERRAPAIGERPLLANGPLATRHLRASSARKRNRCGGVNQRRKERREVRARDREGSNQGHQRKCKEGESKKASQRKYSQRRLFSLYT